MQHSLLCAHLSRRRRQLSCGAAGSTPEPGSAPEGEDQPPHTSTANRLAGTIRRKRGQLEAQLAELGQEGLEERLSSATESPARPAHRLVQVIQEVRTREGRPALVLELRRPSAAATPEDVGRLAAQYVEAGADAVAVRTDAEDTPGGLADLWAACRATRAPVVQVDWLLHPLQIVDAKEAGAAGAIGTIASVSSRATPVMSSFAAAIGLDAPVEVVNLTEVEAMAAAGVPFFGVNLSVGLSLSLPSALGGDVARGIIDALPFGSLSLVGARRREDALRAHAAGADAILVKREWLEAAASEAGGVPALLQELRYATAGD